MWSSAEESWGTHGFGLIGNDFHEWWAGHARQLGGHFCRDLLAHYLQIWQCFLKEQRTLILTVRSIGKYKKGLSCSEHGRHNIIWKSKETVAFLSLIFEFLAICMKKYSSKSELYASFRHITASLIIKILSKWVKKNLAEKCVNAVLRGLKGDNTMLHNGHFCIITLLKHGHLNLIFS